MRRTPYVAVAATVLGQVAHQTVHCREISRVEQLAAFTALPYETRALQALEVKGKR